MTERNPISSEAAANPSPAQGGAVRRDAAYYDGVRESVGGGALTLLLGASTRSLDRSLKRLRAAQTPSLRDGEVHDADLPAVPAGDEPDTAPRVLAQQTAEQVIAEARREADQTIDRGRREANDAAARVMALAQMTADQAISDARREADQMIDRGRREVDGMLGTARRQAELVTTDARARAESLERDAEERHRQAMGSLVQQREELERRVDDLRAFEREYRSRLRAYLEGQLRDLEAGAASELTSPEEDQEQEQAERRVDDLRAFEREYRTRLRAYLEGQLRDLDAAVESDSPFPMLGDVTEPPSDSSEPGADTDLDVSRTRGHGN